ncbi:NAD(P)-dependent oxidoreductase [bacterium]|nr:NAD(P)-dependent oxidoreductase [bacterium]
MASILVTGASGLIGRAMAESLAQKHNVVCMSRKKPADLDLPFVRGEFQSFEDLRHLDAHEIDAVVHLGAVTGGCLERDGILVNVEGTRCLMRYLIDRGVKKFVMASSIAAMGIQSIKNRPLALPIPDEHPCLDRDGYGVSKYLMEEITKYYQRQNEDIDVINLRLASVPKNCRESPLCETRPISPWALGGITRMSLEDAVSAFALAVESQHKPGVRILNAVAPEAWTKDPVAEVLRTWYGDECDLSFFEKPGNEYASVFDPTRIKEEIGFEAELLPSQIRSR